MIANSLSFVVNEPPTVPRCRFNYIFLFLRPQFFLLVQRVAREAGRLFAAWWLPVCNRQFPGRANSGRHWLNCLLQLSIAASSWNKWDQNRKFRWKVRKLLCSLISCTWSSTVDLWIIITSQQFAWSHFKSFYYFHNSEFVFFFLLHFSKMFSHRAMHKHRWEIRNNFVQRKTSLK